jgi:hypothetical protein
MKFQIADREFEIQAAKTKSILEIEQKLGKSLSKIGEDASFSDVVKIVHIALKQSDASLEEGWLEDNTGMEHMTLFTEVMTFFLAIPK